MVSCREFTQVHLDGWVNGTLPPLRRSDCDRHVRDCAPCARYVAGYEGVVALLHTCAAAGDEASDAAAALPEQLVGDILRAVSG